MLQRLAQSIVPKSLALATSIGLAGCNSLSRQGGSLANTPVPPTKPAVSADTGIGGHSPFLEEMHAPQPKIPPDPIRGSEPENLGGPNVPLDFEPGVLDERYTPLKEESLPLPNRPRVPDEPRTRGLFDRSDDAVAQSEPGFNADSPYLEPRLS